MQVLQHKNEILVTFTNLIGGVFSIPMLNGSLEGFQLSGGFNEIRQLVHSLGPYIFKFFFPNETRWYSWIVIFNLYFSRIGPLPDRSLI